jgi:glycosyltransferase involved in cell wall biosynthesis
MRIGVDGCLATHVDGGVGVYTTNIARGLCELGGDEVVVLAPHWARRDLALDDRADDLELEVLTADEESTDYHERRRRWQEGALARRLERGDVDVLLAPVFTYPSAWRGPAVVAVHDLAFAHDDEHNTRPSTAFYRRWARPCAERASAIVTPSRFTHDDVQRRWGIRDKPVHVVALAPSLAFVPTDRASCRALAARELGLARPYLLLVGDDNPRKNLARALRAFAVACQDGLPGEVEMAVATSPTPALAELVRSLGVAERVRFVGYCPPEHLPCLYAGAEAFVYPSLLEGFGLPPLEAMACGTAVAASNGGALPEVVGDHALLFDPLDVGAMAAVMRRLATDEATRRRLEARGRAHASRFSWRATAQATRELLAWAVSRR